MPVSSNLCFDQMQRVEVANLILEFTGFTRRTSLANESAP